jgi:rare lipoprotein A
VKRALALLVALLAASCHRPPPAAPHYVMGAPYEAGGVWYYPRDSYQGEETGLATVYGPDHPDLTADGEVFDQSALAAAHQTLQLPAVARLTNLENGLQVMVRINDRGPATPHRLIEVTRRTATLLQFASNDGRLQSYRVIIGPLASVQQADMVLDQVIRSGVTDARIVVE